MNQDANWPPTPRQVPMTDSLYEQARAAIAARRALIEAGTPGPWIWNVDDGFHDDSPGWIGHDRSGDGFGFQEYVAGVSHHPDGLNDGPLITAAVNAFAADTDVLERAITVAHPIDEDGYCLGRHMHYEGAVLWAECPDARAALTALGVTE